MEVVDSIKAILDGGAPISPTIARHILKGFEAGVSDDSDAEGIDQLTSREREILCQVSDGFTDREIAERANISYHTVTTHIKHIYKKLRVKSRVEATRKALAAGLLTED